MRAAALMFSLPALVVEPVYHHWQYADNIRSEMAKWENVVKRTNMARLNSSRLN